uniref:Uncharacterized protein n=1 Tax=Triticum urartu TaxID=4572 RepID=A0A8R7P6Y8_TRIUA
MLAITWHGHWSHLGRMLKIRNVTKRGSARVITKRGSAQICRLHIFKRHGLSALVTK